MSKRELHDDGGGPPNKRHASFPFLVKRGADENAKVLDVVARQRRENGGTKSSSYLPHRIFFTVPLCFVYFFFVYFMYSCSLTVCTFTELFYLTKWSGGGNPSWQARSCFDRVCTSPGGVVANFEYHSFSPIMKHVYAQINASITIAPTNTL